MRSWVLAVCQNDNFFSLDNGVIATRSRHPYLLNLKASFSTNGLLKRKNPIDFPSLN
jgi:hypothetical protein